ncbi:MAG: hypothetical protein EON58_17565 [Alphaproteobacteria bacterium]|nr:MAG: hypothetical protein EON58_17565 [Alphaproteobacteria bacterium]
MREFRGSATFRLRGEMSFPSAFSGRNARVVESVNQQMNGLLPLLVLAAPTVNTLQVPELSKWQSIPVPPKSKSGEMKAWIYAAMDAPVEWQVRMEAGKLIARPAGKPDPLPAPLIALGYSAKYSKVQPIEGGWLVGVNRGEWGGELVRVWSPYKEAVKVSDHQIVDFFYRKGRLHAIEGLSHLGSSRGAVIRIGLSKTAFHFNASKVIELPAAPRAVTVRRDGTVILILDGSVAALDHRNRLTILLPKLHEFSSNSCAIAPGTTRLYIGMRQYVAELDLISRKLRYLVPSAAYLNRLPEDEERRIREMYRHG